MVVSAAVACSVSVIAPACQTRTRRLLETRGADGAEERTAPRKRQARGERRIGEIVAAAARVLAAHGYEKTTTNAIAAEVGISPGSLYTGPRGGDPAHPRGAGGPGARSAGDEVPGTVGRGAAPVGPAHDPGRPGGDAHDHRRGPGGPAGDHHRGQADAERLRPRARPAPTTGHSSPCPDQARYGVGQLSGRAGEREAHP
nr:TetR/AcrR family transcriptional regulator [Promicromonospora umidemergens]